MSRPLRLEFPGAIFHITSRGNERRPIFGDDEDRATAGLVAAPPYLKVDWILEQFHPWAPFHDDQRHSPKGPQGPRWEGASLKGYPP